MNSSLSTSSDADGSDTQAAGLKAAPSVAMDGAGLRVLVVHHRYRSAQPSGENAVVDDEVLLLREHGAQVEQLELKGDDIERWPIRKKASLPFRVVWSTEGQALLKRAILRAQPDVIHIHNTFPLFSPAIFYTARKSGAGVVHTLHNFRPLCPAGTFLREGKPCEECYGRFPLPAVKYACYRDSRLATLPVAVMDGLHGWLKTWHRCIDRMIVLSEYELEKYAGAGWPESKIRVKYNTMLERDLPQRKPGRHFLSMSRLVPEKGVDVLLEGWRRAFPSGGPPLHLSASGESFDALYAKYGKLPGVNFLGQVDRSTLYDQLTSARAVIVPSLCYEGFPRVVVEAYAAGVPIVASRVGSLQELVDEGVSGLQVRVGDPDDMARALRELANDELSSLLGRGARERYDRLYSPAVTMRNLFGIYREAMAAAVNP